MRNPWLKALAVGLVLAWTGGLAVGGERDMARARGLFAQAQRGIKLEASAAHIKLGIWCRDAGRPPQATAEFLRAVEVSEGQHPLAIKLVDIMRRGATSSGSTCRRSRRRSSTPTKRRGRSSSTCNDSASSSRTTHQPTSSRRRLRRVLRGRAPTDLR
jgi:hypothetical protein